MAFCVVATAADFSNEGEEPETFDPDQFLDDDEIGQGSCSPEAVPSTNLIDCRFPLTGQGWEFYGGPLSQLIRLEDLPFSVSAPCVVEGAELVCRDLVAPFTQDTYRVNLDGYELGDRRPTVVVDREFDSVIGYIQTLLRLKTVAAGGTITLEVFRAGSLDADFPVDVLLRRPGSDEVVERASALAPGQQDGEFSLSVPAPGRWEFVSCAVEGDGCARMGIPTPLNALDATVEELVEGVNNPEDERINLVFLGTGFDDAEQLRSYAASLLSLDGEPIPFSFTGEPVTVEQADLFEWGPFAIEPLAQNVDKFNFWYAPDQNIGSPVKVAPGLFAVDEFDIEAFGLGPHVVVVNLTRWHVVDGNRATGEFPSFVTPGAQYDPTPASAIEVVLPDYREIRFGSVYLPVFDTSSPSEARVLAHELGHSLFGLQDEYVEADSDAARIGPPNCAIDQADAEALWGDLEGRVDPMFDRWISAMEEAGLSEFVDITEADITVGFFEGGCFGPWEGTAVRPTADSLMNNNIPVFGAVNRQRAEAVLDLWPEPTPVATTTTAPPTTSPAATPSSGGSSTTADDESSAQGPDGSSSGDSSGSPLSAPAIVLMATAGTAAVLALVLIVRRRQTA